MLRGASALLGIREADERSIPAAPRTDTVDWERLYREHAPSLRRLIERRVPKTAAEDVLQETFIRAYRSRERLDLSRPVRPFLATLAIRSSIQWHRSHDARANVGNSDRPGRGDTTPFPGSDDHLAGLLETRRVGQALANLTPRHRRLLYLHTVHGYGCRDMAFADQLTTKAVRSALARARTKFRVSYLAF